jgi:hypothetical protein
VVRECPDVVNEFWEGFFKNGKYRDSWQKALTEKALEASQTNFN